MSGVEEVLRAILSAIPQALDADAALIIEDDRLYTAAFPGQRRPRKPWRIGVDASLCAVLQVDDVDSAWMPLVGGTGADALDVIADSINAHAGIEIEAVAPASARARIFTDADLPEWRVALAGA